MLNDESYWLLKWNKKAKGKIQKAKVQVKSQNSGQPARTA